MKTQNSPLNLTQWFVSRDFISDIFSIRVSYWFGQRIFSCFSSKMFKWESYTLWSTFLIPTLKNFTHSFHTFKSHRIEIIFNLNHWFLSSITANEILKESGFYLQLLKKEPCHFWDESSLDWGIYTLVGSWCTFCLFIFILEMYFILILLKGRKLK